MRPANHVRRPTAEEILARIEREERAARRGYHKVFIGFAAGVGKTYEMLNEANRRKVRGEETVIAYVETHGRAGTAAQIGDLETIPRIRIEYRGAVFEEMDAEAVLARNPRLALVDELAHTNVPGSVREKRWMDVEMLLNAGIGVMSTVNVQHLESLNDVVRDITGIRIRETVPDRIVHEADEAVIIDIPPRALINRLERGDVYPPAKVDQAMRNFFREGNLTALREIALKEVAREVDAKLTSYRKAKRIEETWAAQDRIMVCLGGRHPSYRLIRQGWRIAKRLQGDVVAVHVESRPATELEDKVLRDDFALADRLGVPTVSLHGNVADELTQFAREHEITEIVLGHSDRPRMQEIFGGSLVNRLSRALTRVDIMLVASVGDEA
ncbi:MAG: universal stress protein [Armatimonadetes bacterium]|nr:universal stress protein [Armatimonadota bacterium]